MASTSARIGIIKAYLGAYNKFFLAVLGFRRNEVLDATSYVSRVFMGVILFAALCLGLPQPQATRADALYVERAEVLRSKLISELGGFMGSGEPGKPVVKRVDSRQGQRISVHFNDCTLVFNDSSAVRASFSSRVYYNSEPWETESLSDSAVAKIVRSSAEILDGPFFRTVTTKKSVGSHSNVIVIKANLRPVYAGIPAHDVKITSYAEVEHTTGKLVTYHCAIEDPSLPPKSLNQNISSFDSEVAATQLMQALFEASTFGVLAPTELCVYRPENPKAPVKPPYYYSWFNSSDLKSFESNKGVLAYRVHLGQLSEFTRRSETGKGNEAIYLNIRTIYVSAKEGRILTCEAETGGWCGGPPGEIVKLKPFSGELELGEISVSAKGRSLSVPVGGTIPLAALPQGQAEVNTVPVTLKRGRLIFLVDFEPRLGLVRFQTKPVQWAKPNGHLLNACRQLTGESAPQKTR